MIKAPGGGGPPGSSLMSGSGLWMIAALGAILMALALYGLSKETITGTEYYTMHTFRLGDLRLWGEHLLLVTGAACFFTSLACMQARRRAKRLETSDQVKSLQSKRLERVCDQSIFGMIANYIGAFLGQM